MHDIYTRKDRKMKETLIWIGSFILSAILMAIPILLTLSIVMNWDTFIQYILAIPSVIEFVMLVLILQYFALESEE
jgi:ABC-type sugar transport system permease subunit